MSRLRIFADDYGLGERHDAVVRSLLIGSAVNSASVLVDLCSPESARGLREITGPDIRVGLHFNLTVAGSGHVKRPDRAKLLLSCALGQDRRIAEGQLERQLARFRQLFERDPDHIDGHEHCHAFPGLRSVVLRTARERNISVRSMVPINPERGAKARVISQLGRSLRREAERMGVRTNWRFGGILPVGDPDRAIRKLKTDLHAAAAAAASAPGEIWFMVHPGDETDPIQIAGHSARLRRLEAELLAKMSSRNRLW